MSSFRNDARERVLCHHLCDLMSWGFNKLRSSEETGHQFLSRILFFSETACIVGCPYNIDCTTLCRDSYVVLDPITLCVWK